MKPTVSATRFFIDHGMIHDRLTGKHVSTEAIEFDEGRFDTSPIEETCALLNYLNGHSASPTYEDDADNLVGMLVQAAREREAAGRLPDCIASADKRLAEAKSKVLAALSTLANQSEPACEHRYSIFDMQDFCMDCGAQKAEPVVEPSATVDDLPQRLRDGDDLSSRIEAAARIEALEAGIRAVQIRIGARLDAMDYVQRQGEINGAWHDLGALLNQQADGEGK